MSRFMMLFLTLLLALSACSSAPKTTPTEASRPPAVVLQPYTKLDLRSGEAWQAAYHALVAHHQGDYADASNKWRKAHVIDSQAVLYWNSVVELVHMGNYDQVKSLLEELDPAELPEQLQDDYLILRGMVGLDRPEPESENGGPNGT